MSAPTPAARTTSPARRAWVRAWVSLGLMVPAFVGLMSFGEWAVATGAPDIAAVMTGVMAALLAVFAAGGSWFGLQARRAGARAGLEPTVLSALAAVYVVGGLVTRWLGGGTLGG